MRTVRGLICVAMFLTLVGMSLACTQAPDTPAPAPAEKPADQQGTPAATPAPQGSQTGGTVTVGMWSEHSNLLPLLTSSGYEEIIFEALFNKLIKTNEKQEFVADLAEKWEVSPDGCTVTFTLREGVKWHDGQPFTAEDVAFSIRMMAHPDYAGVLYGLIGPIQGVAEYRAGNADDVAGVKVLDAHRVAITTPKPSSTLLNGLVEVRIVPKHILESVPPADWPRSSFNLDMPIGTGPMKFVKYVSGSHLEFERNPDYFEGEPLLDRLILRIGDQNTMLAAFINGEVDVCQVPLGEVDEIKDLPIANVKVVDRESYQIVGLNHRNEILSDVRVRQAIAHAINREQIVKSLLRGYGSVVDAPCTPTTWAYPPDVKKFGYDPDKAKQILDEAGWVVDPKTRVRTKGDLKMEFELLYPTGNLVRMQYAPIVQQNLEAVGIRLNLKCVDFPTLAATFFPNDEQGKPREIKVHELDFWLLGLGAPFLDDATYLRMNFHTDFARPVGQNYQSYSNPRADELIDLCATTVDFEQRKAHVHELLALLAEDVACIPIYGVQDVWVANTRLQEFAPFSSFVMPNLHEWWVK